MEREPVEMQAAIEALPAPLRDTIVQCYLHTGDMAEHAARLGCPQSTVTRRISRAHLLLQEHFAQARAGASLAAERAAMANRLRGGERAKR